MSVKDYLKNIAPASDLFKAIRAESKRNGTHLLSMREINREIAIVRKEAQAKKKEVEQKIKKVNK